MKIKTTYLDFKEYEDLIETILDEWEHDIDGINKNGSDLLEFIQDGLSCSKQYREALEKATSEETLKFDKNLEKYVAQHFGTINESLLLEDFNSFLSKVKKGLIGSSLLTTMLQGDVLSQNQKIQLKSAISNNTSSIIPKSDEIKPNEVHAFRAGTKSVISVIRKEFGLNKPIKSISDKDIHEAIKKLSNMSQEQLDSLFSKDSITSKDLIDFDIDFNSAQYGSKASVEVKENISFTHVSKVINLIKFLKTKENNITKKDMAIKTKQMPFNSLSQMSRELYPFKKDI